MPASRMFSAISLGVFCRVAPSTRAIMRSRKVCPAAAVMRTRIRSDSTCVPPVTAERSPPLSRITGADSPVIAASLTLATPSMTSPSEGMISPASTRTMSPWRSAVAATVSMRPSGQFALRRGLGAGAPQRGGLGAAAAFGHRLGEIGEQHGEPEPEIDLDGEADAGAAGDDVAQQQHRGEHGDDLDHEHHRVAPHDARVELLHGLPQRGQQDARVEQGGGAAAAGGRGGHCRGGHGGMPQ